MSSLFKARESILSVRGLLREARLLEAVKAISNGIGVYLTSQVLAREKKELGALLEKALYLINTDVEFRKLSNDPILYKPGEEKKLFVMLKMFEQNYEKLLSINAEAEDRKFAENKAKILEKAEQHIEKGNYNVAATQLKRIFEEYESDIDMRTRVCVLLYRIEQYEDALGCFQKLEKQKAQAVAPYFEPIAVCYWKNGFYEQAMYYFDLAVVLGKADAHTYLRIGLMHIEYKRMDKAVEALTKSVELDPTLKAAQDALAFANKRNL